MSAHSAAIQSAFTARTKGADTLQLVSFRLGEETYGVEVTKVREIILMGEITQVPQTERFVKGIINLRNTVIPVIDLRARFNLPEVQASDESRIMVIQSDKRTVGMIVDAVEEVFRVARDQITPPPPTIAGHGREFLRGLVQWEGRLLILLEIEPLLAGADESAHALAVA